jgi:glyoxylase-like metal-dependent hydrolase (beta-lactamase superfamily II)
VSVAAGGTEGPAQAGLVVCDGIDYPDGISALDTHYVRAALDASYLVVHGGRAAFVDTGTALAVPRLLGALAARGLAPESVDWVFLTHVHLDHAGGAGALLERLPNARLVVHPRGAAHLVDPARLVAATKQVYGEAVYARLYGELVPVPAARIVSATDGLVLELAGRAFEFLDTPGHALHHVAIHDRDTAGVFSGDTFGVSYRELDVDGREFILPAATPTQFDPAQLAGSVRRILGLGPRAVYPTHYGRITQVERLGGLLLEDVAAYAALARHAAESGAAGMAALGTALWDYHSRRLDAHGFAPDPARRHALLDPDLALNADGLRAFVARAGR